MVYGVYTEMPLPDKARVHRADGSVGCMAAFGMLGDKTVKRQSEVGLRQSIANSKALRLV